MKYFQHDLNCRENDKVWELIDRHGLQGYGAWWVIVEELYKAEENGFKIEVTETWLKRLGRSLNLSDYRTIPRLLDTMAEVGLISSQLWADHILYVEGVIERGDSYVQRKAQSAERKRRERSRKSKNVTRDTSATNANVTLVTLSETEAYSDLNSTLSPISPLENEFGKESERDSALPHSEPTEPVIPNQSASLSSQSKASATNQGAIEDKYSAESPRDFFAERAANVLPPWRVKRGPNGWNEKIVQGVLDWMKESFGSGKTRADAVTYIARRESPSHPEHAALVARCEEIQAKQSRQATSASGVFTAQSLNYPEIDPTDPDYIAARKGARELFQKALQKQGVSVNAD